MLETALTVTDSVTDPSVSESFPVLPRLHPGQDPGAAAVPRPLAVGPPGSGRHAWSRDRRAMLAAEFLASDEAEDLSDRGSASHCADRIIDYGCEQGLRAARCG